MATMPSEVSTAPASTESAAPSFPKEIALPIAELALTLFLQQKSTPISQGGQLIAVTAPIPGEGVTTVASWLAMHLARNPASRVLLASTADLEPIHTHDGLELEHLLRRDPATGVWSFDGRFHRNGIASGRWATQASFRRALLGTLRDLFDCLVLDCPAVDTSADLAHVATLVDGVLLVVSSGGSTRSQIERAQRTIENAGGTLDGCCFNRHDRATSKLVNRMLGR